MPASQVVSQYADKVMALIDEDIAAGRVPADVPGFSELHNYVDANLYVLDAEVPYDTSTQEGMALINAVDDECHRRLQQRLA